MITYSIQPSTEEGGEDVIVKTGQSHKFKMSDVKAHLDKLAKFEKELEAQIKLEEAKMINVYDRHDSVHNLTDEQMNAISVYYAAKSLRKNCEDKLKEVINAKTEYYDEIKDIEAQTGKGLQTKTEAESEEDVKESV
jgi:hypothetical protein